MAKCIAIIHNGIEYDPYNIPPEVLEEIQNKLVTVTNEILNEEEIYE